MPREEIDWDNLIFTKPSEAVAQIKREAVAEARHIIQQDYFRVTNRERWEKMFYRAYPHLASSRELVEQAMGEVGTQMPQNTPIQTANAAIAEKVEARIKHRKRFGPIDDERAMWSGSPEGDGPSEPTPQDHSGTLGDTIKARRERRQSLRSGRVISGDHI